MQATSFPSSISLCLIKQIGRQNFYFIKVYMGNKFLALRKSEVAKAAPDRAGIPGVPADRGIGEQVEFGEWKGFLLTVLERRPKHKQEG